MSRVISLCVLLALVTCLVSFAQAPTGIIAGTVTDETGAVIPNVTVTITNKATSVARTAQTNAEGLYSAPALLAGDYEVRAEAPGFRTLQRDATVQAGVTTTVNLPMSLGESKSVVTVEAATAQINYDSHTVQGTIERATIQDLPLNGRSFMQLAGLEPGVTVSAGSTAQFNALFTVSVMGSGNHTVYTIDGGNVSDSITTSGGISSMNFSQEIVQEFQLSTVNFDLSTSIAAGGALNVVTRSGSNDFHGSGYFFFRDHNMAAYPALARNPLEPNPFFARRNPGASLGGPIKKDKVFFYFNYEYMNQVQALTLQGTLPSVEPLTGTYGSPYVGKLITFRIDDHLSAKNNLFVRYSHDGNTGIGPALTPNSDPSNWADNINWSDQGIIGLTSILTPNIVNDVRVQYDYWSNKNLQTSAGVCSLPCVAGSLPTINTILGANISVGPNLDAPQARQTRRGELNDSLSWQKGSHRIKFGGDIDRARTAGLWGFCTPFCTNLVSPEFLLGTFTRFYGAATMAALFPTLPSVLHSDADIVNLPIYSTPSSIFNGVGVGQDATPAPYNYGQNLYENQYRAYVQDTWKVKQNLTVNFGLGWNAQTGYYGVGLSFPQYLSPIYGNNLSPTSNNVKEMQPAFGFAWSPGKSGKTVIRGGGGIYWDSTPGYYKIREGPVIGPLGDGRSTLAASAFTNIFPGLFNLSTGKPVPVGAPLPLSQFTNMTLGQFEQVLAQQLPAVESKLAPSSPQTSGPYSVSGIDVAKQGVEIYPPGGFPLPRSYQTSIGVQRDLGHDMVVSADWARRQGENVSLGEIDMNHAGLYVNGVADPVIPTCTQAQVFVPGQECSTGNITQWMDEGRSVYEGLLVKLQKRLSHNYQFTASYAYQNLNSVTLWNEVGWFNGYGPQIPRQNFNVAGIVNLPWGFQLSINSSIVTSMPQEPVIGAFPLPGVDLSSSNQALPGLSFNCLNISCGKTQLANAVANYNSTYAGTKASNGSTFPTLVLPQNYDLGTPIISQDFRLTKTFTYKERYKLSILGEMFNAFNVANLTYPATFTLDPKAATPASQTYSFGQPIGRVLQTFGSGGPRAVQVGARITF